jgi:hypothetical protein
VPKVLSKDKLRSDLEAPSHEIVVDLELEKRKQ